MPSRVSKEKREEVGEFALRCSEVARVDSIGSVCGKEEKQVLEASKYSSSSEVTSSFLS
jgi:hypothetical protein